jgi:acyl dehydratase
MPLDLSAARALVITPLEVDIERGRLRAFARAIGETDPVYLDVDAARAAGHPDVPVPPTYFFSIEMEAVPPLGWLTDGGIELSSVLHGEQRFRYHRILHAGERVSVHRRIADAYAKGPGAFLVKKTEFLRDGELVAEAEGVVIVKETRA